MDKVSLTREECLAGLVKDYEAHFSEQLHMQYDQDEHYKAMWTAQQLLLDLLFHFVNEHEDDMEATYLVEEKQFTNVYSEDHCATDENGTTVSIVWKVEKDRPDYVKDWT